MIVIPFWRHLFDEGARNLLPPTTIRFPVIAALVDATSMRIVDVVSISISDAISFPTADSIIIVIVFVGVDDGVDEFVISDPSVGICVGDFQNGRDLRFRQTGAAFDAEIDADFYVAMTTASVFRGT